MSITEVKGSHSIQRDLSLGTKIISTLLSITKTYVLLFFMYLNITLLPSKLRSDTHLQNT